MLEELERLIAFIEMEYERISQSWKENDLYVPINQKKKLVKDVVNDASMMVTILNYRSFINRNHLDIKDSLENLKLTYEVDSRVKAQNSIEYKINNYMTNKHEKGEVALNRCFNDLYGLRIVFKDSVEFSAIKDFIENKYHGRLKGYNASKGDYVAIHIYFKKDNYSFQWELQL